MDLHRLGRAPAGVGRRWRDARRSYAACRFRTALRCDPDAPPVLLSPHWDDAIFDCWSLLSSTPRLTVINVFAGIPPTGLTTRWDRITGATDSASRARERIDEDADALETTGHTPLNLALLDAEYRAPAPAPSLPEIDRAVRGVAPATARIYAPAALGQNQDHRLVRWYAQMLLHRGVPVSLYADLPYCVVHGWPHWVDGSPPDPHRDVDVFWHTFLTDVPELRNLRSARVTRLDDRSAEAKLRAMRRYRTQFPSLDAGAGGLLSNPATHRFEVVWDLDGTTDQYPSAIRRRRGLPGPRLRRAGLRE